MRKRNKFGAWFRQKLILDILDASALAEKELRKKAREQAFISASGMGGITSASFVTSRPWKYETSFFRKLAWVIYLSFFNRKATQVVLPLKLSEYQDGRWVIFHSGIKIEKCGRNEMVTTAHAFFDPFRR